MGLCQPLKHVVDQRGGPWRGGDLLQGGRGREGAEGRRRVGRRLPREGPALISSKCILVIY